MSIYIDVFPSKLGLIVLPTSIERPPKSGSIELLNMGKNMGRGSLPLGGRLDGQNQGAGLQHAKIASIREARPYADGGSLYLRVAPGGSKGWIFRFTLGGRTRDAGLGATQSQPC